VATPTVRAVVDGPRKITLHVRTDVLAAHLHSKDEVDQWLARYGTPTLERLLREAWDTAAEHAGGSPTGTPPDTPKVTVAEALDLTRHLNAKAN
jgi:hypothetical protein